MIKQQQEDNEATLKCFNTNERKTKPLLNDHQREGNDSALLTHTYQGGMK